VIRQSTAKDRGPDSRRDPDEDGDRQRRERKLERRGERISQVLGNGATRADALAKIAVKNARHVNDVLLRQRPVEAVFGSELRDLRLGGVIAERGGHRIRRDEVRDRERDDRNADHHGRDPDDAS